MEHDRLLETARALLAQPTAPFHEEAVRAEIERRLAPLPGVTLQRDAFGNVLAKYQRGEAPARFAFAVHMDHPAYVAGEFLGGVPEAYRAKRPPTRDFGSFAMWDLPAFELRDGCIHSRACDDLIGCAAVVSLFQELARRQLDCACCGLFTRAEEIGFAGAIHLAKSGLLPPELTIISLETSSERGGPITMGEGVIIRVGDRTSIFDSSATASLVQLAHRHEIPHQRALMSGGTCEATAYQLYGYRSAGLCVALGNYHNCGPDEQIAAEYVSLRDYASMTALCLAAATEPAGVDPADELRHRLEANLEKYRAYFGADAEGSPSTLP